MAFKRYACTTELLATWEPTADGQGFKRAASSKVASVYGDGIKQLNIASLLSKVADEYDISPDPNDYIFEAVRALTADVFNENGDGFAKSELLRFNHKLGQAVYQTFQLKPHFVNHRADNPKAARGVVLDAHYNDENPPLEYCPNDKCRARTAERENRDRWGNRCAKCGTVCKDEFVEILIAIDKKKDPLFAEGVRTGALNATSMGCDCDRTRCNVCGNVAYSKKDFCTHIRHSKKRMVRDKDGIEKYAGEWCEEVVFSEDSRVDQPADPRALQHEVFHVSASLTGGPRRVTAEELRAETEELIRRAKARRMASELWSRRAQIVDQPPVTSSMPNSAPKSMDDMAAAGDADTDEALLEEIEEELADTHPEVMRKIRLLVSGDDTVPIEEMQEQFRQGNDAMGGPAAMGVESEEFQATTPVQAGLDDTNYGPTANEESSVALGGDGMDRSVNNSRQAHMNIPFANVYEDLSTVPAKSGLVRVASNRGGGTIFSVQAPEGANLVEFQRKVLAHIAENGLTSAIVEFDGILSPRAASIVDHYFSDMKDGPSPSEKPLTSGAWETQAEGHNSPESSAVDGGDHDHAEEVGGSGKGSVTRGPIRDHKVDNRAKDKITDGATDDLNAERSKSPKDTLDDCIMDHKTAQAESFEGGGDTDPFGGEPAPESEHAPESEPAGVDGSVELEVEVDLGDGPKTVLVKGQNETDPDTGEEFFNVTEATCDGEDCLDQLEASPEAAEAIQAAVEAQLGGGEGPVAGEDAVGEVGGEGDDAEPVDDVDTTVPDFGDKSACGCGQAGCEKCASVGNMRITAAVQKHATRIERIFAKRLEAERRKIEAAVEEARTAAANEVREKWLDALRLAAKRQALNLEHSPIKEAFGEVLCNSMRLTASEEYPGMDGDTAVHLIEAASARGFEPFVASLIEDAEKFMSMPKEAVAALRRDAEALQPIMPVVEDSHRRSASVSDVERAEDLRRQAVAGNMELAPAASDTPVGISKTAKRESIRMMLRNPRYSWFEGVKSKVRG